MSRYEGGSTLTQLGGGLLERRGGGGESVEEIGTVVLGAQSKGGVTGGKAGEAESAPNGRSLVEALERHLVGGQKNHLKVLSQGVGHDQIFTSLKKFWHLCGI